MEVHQHAHAHSKKTWKNYIWEFVMLFLAVFCGFLAEYKLEHIIESQREKEYAKTLYAELLSDSVVISDKLKARAEKERSINYLNAYFKDSSLTKLSKEFYPAFTIACYLINTYAFEPKDGILSQLRNSGSLRYFKSIPLQKLLGDLNVDIINIRTRNDQEYQYFSSPMKLFLLNHFDFSWLDEVRRQNPKTAILEVIRDYLKADKVVEANILNVSSFNRGEASNIILFHKQMLKSTQTLQLNNYIITSSKILNLLRKTYRLEEVK